MAEPEVSCIPEEDNAIPEEANDPLFEARAKEAARKNQWTAIVFFLVFMMAMVAVEVFVND